MSDRNALFKGYLTNHFSHVVANEKARKHRKAMLHHNYRSVVPTDKDAPILEIGPGYGELLELLVASYGYTAVQAVDISLEVVEFCNRVVPRSTLFVEDTQVFLGEHTDQFAQIFMFHLLEHIPKSDTLPLLEAAYHALSPGGQLVLEVPNMAHPLIGLNQRYADFTHEVGFTEASVQYVLQRAGFSQISLGAVTLPWDHYTRPFQAVARGAIEAAIQIVYRAYASRSPHVLTPALCAVATKPGSHSAGRA